MAEGADILDIGGESTRPYSTPVTEDEELRRVIPVIHAIAEKTKVPISVDTSKARVAYEAIAAGAEIINDVTGLTGDPQMMTIARESGAGICAMHMQGTPQTMQHEPRYNDVVTEVGNFFADCLARCAAAGLPAENVAIDVGIGFGKSLEHNLELLAAVGSFKSLGRPLMLGVSRKSFIGKLLGVEMEDRLPAALACACHAVANGVQIIRAHDVAATVQAVRMTEAIAHGR